MTRFLKLIVIVALVVCNSTGRAELQQPEMSLESTCARMLSNQYDRADMRVLSKYAVNPEGKRELRSMAMAVFALSALAHQETNLFAIAKARHATDFPEQKMMLRLDIRDCYSECKNCAGEGHLEEKLDCSTCGGSGKCMHKDCENGKWVVIAPGPGGPSRKAGALPCPVCKGSGRCSQCEGVRTLRTTCTACSGKRILFSCPKVLTQNYESLLRDMLTLLNTDKEITSRLLHVRAETNLQTRIRLCNDFIADYGSDARAGEVKDMKAAAQKIITDTNIDEQAKLTQISKDIGMLRGHIQTLPKETIAEVLAYLEKHRAQLRESDILALNGIKNECTAKIERDAKRIKTYYIAGGIAVFLLALSCINVHFYRYTILSSPSTGAPARRNINSSVTDPLSLSAKESRGRVKTKTSNIMPLDE